MPRILPVLAAGALLAAAPAQSLTLDFESFEHGEVVADRVASHGDWTLVADNPNRSFDIAAAFDTGVSGSADPDLEMGTGWSGGNVDPDTQLGNILILQENSTGCSTGVCSNPDDEGSRPAGSLLFLFDETFTVASIDLVDVELGAICDDGHDGRGEHGWGREHGFWHKTHRGSHGREHGLWHKLHNGNRGPRGADAGSEDGTIRFFNLVDGEVDTLVAEYTFRELADLFPDVEFGNNTVNHIDFGEIGPFNAVEIDLGGSGGIDNLVVVPEPATFSLLSLGLAGLGVAGRRRPGVRRSA